MALVLPNRVKETTTTTGTGTVTLGGAAVGYQSFAAVGNANTTYYCIAGQGTNEWEVGIGTYTSAGTTLSRDTILASSNSGLAVNFSSGTKDVFVTYPAERGVWGNGTTLVAPAGALLPIANGGTNSSATATAGGVGYGTGTAHAYTAAGTAGQFLQSNGASAPTWATVASFDAGTRMLFAQTAAPTGWTKDTTNYNNYALRVVTGTAGTGGTVDFTAAFVSQAVTGTVGTTGATAATGTTDATTATGTNSGGTVSSYTLATTDIPSHNHQFYSTNTMSGAGNWPQGSGPNSSYTHTTTSTGGGGGHTHAFTQPTFTGTAHTHTFTSATHTHTGGTFTGTAINLAVKYLDVITATKN